MTPANMDLLLTATNKAYRALPFEKLAQWVVEGRISPQDQVRPVGTDVWIAVRDVPELYQHVPAAVRQAYGGAPAAEPRPAPRAAPVAAPVADSVRSAPSATIGLPDDFEPSRVRRRRRSVLEDTELDMTPMIDVVFQLLIFFMFANQMANAPPLDVPDAVHGRGIMADGVQSILIDEHFELYLGDTVMDEAAVASVDALVNEVGKNAAQAPQPLDVTISAHRKAIHGSIRQLVERLQALGNIGQVRFGVSESQSQ